MLLSETCWTLSPPDLAPSWRAWSGEVVLYNDSSGSTHLLAGVGGYVFAALLDAPDGLTPAEILHSIAQRLDLSELPEQEAAIAAALTEFERLGIASTKRP